ncbi:hypothetical protein NMY22_g2843 [Coprinellus aureogranulatus]|nr:hypothetical protein NMY22_g2843 [Coprinellus aureogranulatus]
MGSNPAPSSLPREGGKTRRLSLTRCSPPTHGTVLLKFPLATTSASRAARIAVCTPFDDLSKDPANCLLFSPGRTIAMKDDNTIGHILNDVGDIVDTLLGSLNGLVGWYCNPIDLLGITQTACKSHAVCCSDVHLVSLAAHRPRKMSSDLRSFSRVDSSLPVATLLTSAEVHHPMRLQPFTTFTLV